MRPPRTFLKSEMAEVAECCLRAISLGEDPVDVLDAKGVENPVEEWYNIRRWIKSNKPAEYAGLPMRLKLELPSRNNEKKEGGTMVEFKDENPAEERLEECSDCVPADPGEDLTGFETVPPPKRRGRPKGWKKSEQAEERLPAHIQAMEKRPAKERKREVAEPDPVKQETVQMHVRTVESDHFQYDRIDDTRIRVTMIGAGDHLVLTQETLRELVKGLPTAFGMLKA